MALARCADCRDVLRGTRALRCGVCKQEARRLKQRARRLTGTRDTDLSAEEIEARLRQLDAERKQWTS